MLHLKSSICRFAICLTIMSFFSGCDKDDDVYTINHNQGPAVGSLISFKSISELMAEADGESFISVVMNIHAETAEKIRGVKITSSIGTFSNGETSDSIGADATGQVEFQIKSDTPGQARVSATVKNVTVDTILTFEPALPHDIAVTFDKYVAAATDNIIVTCELKRLPFKGEVSDPISVSFEVIPETSGTGNESLVYPEFVYSEENKAVITISNPFELTGGFFLEASSMSADGEVITNRAYFKIQ